MSPVMETQNLNRFNAVRSGIDSTFMVMLESMDSLPGIAILKLSFTLWQRLLGTASVLNRHEIRMDKPCVYTRPGGSGMDRICYLVPNGSTYECDPIWNHTVPGSNRSTVNRVDPIPNGSEHVRSRVNVALVLC